MNINSVDIKIPNEQNCITYINNTYMYYVFNFLIMHGIK